MKPADGPNCETRGRAAPSVAGASAAGLFEHIAHARARGAATLIADVVSTNRDTLGFFWRLGFAIERVAHSWRLLLKL
jgi:hypothetical protein